MSAPRFLKICGITRGADAEFSVRCGATALGFVFWPASPRCVEPSVARSIVASLPGDVMSVGVFVDQPAEYVSEIAALVGLGVLQLHGDESSEYAATLGRPILKAMPLVQATDEAMARWSAETTILLDAHDPVRRGGTGTTIDWTGAAAVARRRKIVLAGGLNPDNIADAIERVQPFGIDVSSGVEHTPGVKDHRKVEALFEAIHKTAARQQVSRA